MRVSEREIRDCTFSYVIKTFQSMYYSSEDRGAELPPVLAPSAAPLKPPPIVDWDFDRGWTTPGTGRIRGRSRKLLHDLWSDYLSHGIDLA